MTGHLTSIREENFALVGYYASNSGNFFPTFRDNLSFPSSGVKNWITSRNSVAFTYRTASPAPGTLWLLRALPVIRTLYDIPFLSQIFIAANVLRLVLSNVSRRILADTVGSTGVCAVCINLLATDFFQILAHPVFKM